MGNVRVRGGGEKAGRALDMRGEAFFRLDFFAYFLCLRQKVGRRRQNCSDNIVSSSLNTHSSKPAFLLRFYFLDRFCAAVQDGEVE